MSTTKVPPKARPSQMFKDKAGTPKSTIDLDDLLEDRVSTSGSDESDQEKHEGEDGEGQKSKEKMGKGRSQDIHIDREEYLQAYKELTHDKNQLKIKNNILHRRLADYYKKRKLEHVLKPLEVSMDLEEKYQQKLFAYEVLKEKEETETVTMMQKLQEVTNLYERREEQAVEKFKALQDHERSTGTGLIYASRGKPIAEKTVQRFMSLQKTKFDTASAMMLRYLRVRNAVSDQEAIIRKLERIGPGLYVAQYEQLRVEKLNYTNKIEEREDELIRNRLRCTEHNQMLAHIREKMHHTTEIIDITECDYGDAEIEYQQAREALNKVKTKRDRLRIITENEIRRAGLITRKLLLRDYQDSIEMVVKLREKKANLEYQIAKYNMELRNARQCIKSEAAAAEEDSFDILF
ncbi:coiled-coil domain-containing protein 96 [Phthorimaea operculella]|nr:coiled-coil domain-containing protein 96 [Phthorimaea operculella]